MNQLLEEMLSAARCDLAKQKMLLPEEEVLAMCQGQRPVRDIVNALKRPARGEGAPRILGRIQKAEPESGFLRKDFDALALARNLQKAGAAALAVVTEPHVYLGKNSTLSGVARLATVPVVRFDCIIDRYQIAQTYLWGGDAVTLFPAMLDQSELASLAAFAAGLKLGVIGIAYNAGEIERLLAVDSIGIIGAGEAELLRQIPFGKVALCCAEQPDAQCDAWAPERSIMAAETAEALQKIFQEA